MKNLILLPAFLFTMSVIAIAQDAPKKPTNAQPTSTNGGHEKMTVEQRAQHDLDDMTVAASLSEDQKGKIKPLIVTRISKIDAIKAKYKGQAESQEIAKSEIEAVRKEYKDGLKPILTVEQFEKIRAAKKPKTESTEGSLSK